MARIAGVDLPREKRIEIGLTYIYGIGRPSADKILAKAEVNPDTRVRDLTDDEVKRLSAVIDETMTVEGDLRREIALNIKRLQEIGCLKRRGGVSSSRSSHRAASTETSSGGSSLQGAIVPAADVFG